MSTVLWNPTLIVRHLVRHLVRLRHPDERVSSGNGVPPVSYSDMSRSNVSLLHRLRSRSFFTGRLLARIVRKSGVNCSTCDVRDDIEHVLIQCVTYGTNRYLLFAALRAGGHRHSSVDDLLFSEGGP